MFRIFLYSLLLLSVSAATRAGTLTEDFSEACKQHRYGDAVCIYSQANEENQRKLLGLIVDENEAQAFLEEVFKREEQLKAAAKVAKAAEMFAAPAATQPPASRMARARALVWGAWAWVKQWWARHSVKSPAAGSTPSSAASAAAAAASVSQ